MNIKELENIVHDKNLGEVTENVVLVQEIILFNQPEVYHIVIFKDDTVWLYIGELSFYEWEEFKGQVDNDIEIIEKVKEIAPFLD